MTAIFAEQALLPGGWRGNVRIAFDGGRISEVEAGSSAHAGDERHAIVLPGMPNLHSHAFQRGMA
ncbi:MAG: formimidoylglutamate deiminase, partial [Mesorhizobium sp.]